MKRDALAIERDRAALRLLAAWVERDPEDFAAKMDDLRIAYGFRSFQAAARAERDSVLEPGSRRPRPPGTAITSTLEVLRGGGDLGVPLARLAEQLGVKEKTALAYARQCVRRGDAEEVAPQRWRIRREP